MDTTNHRLNFHIALHEPEMPANTGNIGRLCVGSGSRLHIIKPMRFLITDKYLKRAGLDYWNKLDIVFHNNLEEFLESFKDHNVYFMTTKSSNNYSKIKFRSGDVFLFGAESKGLPEELLCKYPENTLTIPMTKDIRSINLANSVAIVLYEAWRQLNWKQEDL